MNRKPDEANGNLDLREESIKKIRHGVEEGLSFDQACGVVFIDNRELREAVISDALKTLIAEIHISGGMPLKQLAMKLRLSMSRLIRAKENMQRELEEAEKAKNKGSVEGRLGIPL